jgi:hypothetical protein
MKKISWYLLRGLILTKDNLVKRKWQGNNRCVCFHHEETIKHLFFQCCFAIFIWPIIQVALGLYPPRSVVNIFRNWLHGIDLRFRTLIRVVAIVVIWSLWLCRNDKKTKIVLSCRTSTDVPVCSVCGHLFSDWRIENYF